MEDNVSSLNVIKDIKLIKALNSFQEKNKPSSLVKKI